MKDINSYIKLTILERCLHYLIYHPLSQTAIRKNGNMYFSIVYIQLMKCMYVAKNQHACSRELYMPRTIKLKAGHSQRSFTVAILPYILKTITCAKMTAWGNDTMRPDV